MTPRTLIAAIAAAALFATPAAAQEWMKTLGKVIEATTGGEASGGGTGLGVEDIAAGLREALKVGTERVVSRVGAVDGYNADPAIHIPLPPELRKVQEVMKRFGLSALADDVETRLNRGAEAAAPKAKELIWKAITDMTLEDARRIYDGPDDAATQYFRRVSTADLTAAVKPVVGQSLEDVGAIAAYDSLLGEYRQLPFVPDVRGDLTNHATGLALEGLFHYLAQEEKAIREDPAKRTTEILTRVFGG